MFECVCIYHGDGSEPEFISERIVTAKKKHCCHECGCIINPGEKYEYVAGVWDGDFDVWKTCLPCATIRKDFMECGWIYGELWQDLYEQLADSDNDEENWWLEP